MNTHTSDWEARVAAVWAQAEAMAPESLVAAIDALAAERGADDAPAMFERACARDTAGWESDAEGFYRAALATGRLDAYRRARASLQLGSTLRLLGRLDESEALLAAELARQAGDAQAPLRDEACALLALTYAAQGRATEAAGLALSALAPRLSRYNRSMARHAQALLNAGQAGPDRDGVVQPRRVAAALPELWSPRVIGELDDCYVKVAKVQGTLAWHSHDGEDELFLVLQGRLRIEMEGRSVDLAEGEMFVVPKGVRHNPVAEQECLLMLIERKSTRHTGSVVTDKTRSLAEQLRPLQQPTG